MTSAVSSARTRRIPRTPPPALRYRSGHICRCVVAISVPRPRAMKLRSAAPDARDDASRGDTDAGSVLPTVAVQRPRPAAGATWDKRLGCVLWPLGLLSLLLVLDTARRHALYSLVARAFRACSPLTRAADALRYAEPFFRPPRRSRAREAAPRGGCQPLATAPPCRTGMPRWQTWWAGSWRTGKSRCACWAGERCALRSVCSGVRSC